MRNKKTCKEQKRLSAVNNEENRGKIKRKREMKTVVYVETLQQ